MKRSDLPDDLELLFALDVFLRERHITRAARHLGVTQGAASQKLARLRDYFGDPLLVPGRPLLHLTPRALAIAEPLEVALQGLRAAVRAAERFDPRTSERRFVLLGGDLLDVSGGPVLLNAIHSIGSKITLALERVTIDFQERLAKGTADAAFVTGSLVSGALRQRVLPPDPFVVVVRNDHPALQATGKQRRLDLKTYLSMQHLLVAPLGFPGGVVDDALARLGKARHVAASVQHFISAPFLIAGSDLVVTCPRSVYRSTCQWLPIAALEPPAELELAPDVVCLVWHERSHRDPGFVWVRSVIDAHFRA
jgi:DNA-binding transcriptional LysR family regulator